MAQTALPPCAWILGLGVTFTLVSLVLLWRTWGLYREARRRLAEVVRANNPNDPLLEVLEPQNAKKQSLPPPEPTQSSPEV
jgi:hypothetical protein